MSDYDDMLVRDFREMVKEREFKRVDLAHEINKLTPSYIETDHAVGKALRKGVPELSTSIVKLINSMYENARSMGNMVRRVEESVSFGDCQSAMEIFKSFEKDELSMSDNARNDLKEALSRLGIKPDTAEKTATKKNGRGKKSLK